LARLRHEKRFDAPVTDVFVALVRTLALRRWDPAVATTTELAVPKAGTRYARQTTTAFRTGRVVEVIRPVSVTLHETLSDPPCHVSLKQRWRIDTVSGCTLLRLIIEYRLNQAATFRQLHWRKRLSLHSRKMLELVARELASAPR